ncbi:MAG: DUF4145 domain-containing protein [Nitrososphaera sp.]
MASEDTTTAPIFQVEEFTCPFCAVYAHQTWTRCRTYYGTRYGGLKDDDDPQTWHAQCFRCKKFSVWHEKKTLYPTGGMAPFPDRDLPVDAKDDPEDKKDHIKDDYLEAGAIVTQSPRGAAALLRLVVEKLVNRIIKERKFVVEKHQNDINGKIGILVKNGLRKEIQQALDVVRVTGNNAVHPLGMLDLKDDTKTALRLFKLVNMIVEDMFTKPKELQSFYDGLPDEAKQVLRGGIGKIIIILNEQNQLRIHFSIYVLLLFPRHARKHLE